MNTLLKINERNLPNLRNIYEIEKPLHIVTLVAISHFIKRFKTKPEWEEKVNFWTLNEQWKENGTFAMVNKNDRHILFNTLEPWPYQSLRRTLELLDYDEKMVFICFRDIFRPIVFHVIRIRNLDTNFDSGTKCMYMPSNVYEHRQIDIPTGYCFNSLNESHVNEIDSVSANQFSGSRQFLSNCIAQNPSTGLFNKETGELVAWTITLETGAIGYLQVLEKYQQKGFGEITKFAHLLKVKKECQYDIVGHVVHQNSISFNLMTRNGAQWIDNNSWIGVRPRKPLKIIPLWGHL